MARIILVTGGARSGKSRYAESLLAEKQPVTYIAPARIEDAEMQERVRQHQCARPPGWKTFEGTYHLAQAVTGNDQTGDYLIDCLTVLTANIMFDSTHTVETISGELQQAVEDAVIEEIERFIRKVQACDSWLVMVTNEVGCAIVPENHVARVYRDILGRVNQRVAALCDEVYLVACGLPLRLK